MEVVGAGAIFWRFRRGESNLAKAAAGGLTKETDASAQTPAMRQYFAAKEAHPDCLMFCRIGDFYELFYEDAIIASRELQLTLTARDREKKQPMCGVPYHAVDQYIQRLLRKGYRIALCDQMEDPKLTKKIVRREVTRVLTPGTAVDAGLGAEQSNWLASVCIEGSGATACAGLALVDLSTGEFRATEFAGPTAWAQLMDEVGRVRPVEMLVAENELAAQSRGRQPTLSDDAGKDGAPSSVADAAFEGVRTTTGMEDWVFTADYAVPLLRRHFGVHSLDGMGLAGHEAAATAAGALVHYLQKTKQGGLEHIDTIRFYERAGCLVLDAVSVRNLELVEPLFAGESAQTTLFHTLDACCTPMGKRLLRATLLRRQTISARLRRGWKRLRKRWVICPGAKGCAALWAESWTWSGCWAGWRSIRPGHGKFRPWRRRWRACRECGMRLGTSG